MGKEAKRGLKFIRKNERLFLIEVWINTNEESIEAHHQVNSADSGKDCQSVFIRVYRWLLCSYWAKEKRYGRWPGPLLAS